MEGLLDPGYNLSGQHLSGSQGPLAVDSPVRVAATSVHHQQCFLVQRPSDARAGTHPRDGFRGESDAPPQRLGGRGSEEPGGQEARAEGIPRPRGVNHPRRRRGYSLPSSVRVGVQSTLGAELQDDTGVVRRRASTMRSGSSTPASNAPSSRFGKHKSAPRVDFRKRPVPTSRSSGTDEGSTETHPDSRARRRAFLAVSLRLPPEKV